MPRKIMTWKVNSCFFVGEWTDDRDGAPAKLLCEDGKLHAIEEAFLPHIPRYWGSLEDATNAERNLLENLKEEEKKERDKWTTHS